MKPLKLSPRQAQVLAALCELGQTDLVAYKLKITEKTVHDHIFAAAKNNGYPNRLTLALAFDRSQREKMQMSAGKSIPLA